MKTLLTSTALVAMMSTSAMAFTAGPSTTFDWQGDSSDGTNGVVAECTFTGNTDGTMELNADKVTWETTTAASVTVTARNGSKATDMRIGSIVVDPVQSDLTTQGGQLQQLDAANNVVDTWDAEVDYEDTMGGNTPAGWTLLVAPAIISNSSVGNSDMAVFTDNEAINGKTANLTSASWKIELAGTATPALGSNEVLDGNTKFRVQHRVTCFTDTLDVDLDTTQ